eukprot:COSAG03_NODE_748_length_6004_cov_3.279255_1_plen_43_part_00
MTDKEAAYVMRIEGKFYDGRNSGNWLTKINHHSSCPTVYRRV